MTDLSVLIPARNEMFLKNTVEDVLTNIRAETEIIVILDGAWAEPALVQHDRVTIVHRPESIGQRATTNLAARLSSAKYVMKLDAHCAVAEGFDSTLIQSAKELGREVTQIPAQYNLHVFDWVCDGCKHRTYQGPTPVTCAVCGAKPHHKEMIWKARERRLTTAWRFDADLHFQYFPEWQGRPEGKLDYPETMSCLGACWFLERDRYWELGGLDEQHGSWGQMGTELGCKSWLSGGRMVTNRKTWFAHMFRTQGGDFGFPYELRGSEVQTARNYSQRLWKDNTWPGQKKPLSWLVERFWPVPGWTGEQFEALRADGAKFEHGTDGWTELKHSEPIRFECNRSVVSKGCVYYSDNRVEDLIFNAVQNQLDRAAKGLDIVSVTLKPISFGRNLVLPLDRGYLTMAKQILAGLEASTADVIFFTEHDVLYHPSHFEFIPPKKDVVFYNENVWKVDCITGRALFYYCRQLSGLCAYRETLLTHYRKRVDLIEKVGFSRKMGFEPGTHRRSERVDDLTSDSWMSTFPNIDIRHSTNLTPSRWKKEQFRDQRYTRGWTEADSVPGWGLTQGRFIDLLKEVSC
jgi:glycosyltransferase involved in cell wall biosynthesis